MVARDQSNFHLLSRTTECLEDAWKLFDDGLEFVRAGDVHVFPKAECIAGDDKLLVTVFLLKAFEECDQLILKIANAERFLAANVQIADEIVGC